MDNEIHMLPIDSLRPNPNNPRRHVGDVTELAESIKAQGIRQNLLVVPDTENHGPNDQSTVYRIVIGHRRYTAAKQAGLTQLPCVIADLDPRQERELMLVENTQRADLTALEEADGYQGLLDLGADVRDMAAKTGRSQNFVRQRLRLAGIGTPARTTMQATQPTVEALITLSEFNDHPDLQNDLAGKITEDGTLPGYYVQNARDTMSRREWFRAADEYCQSHGLTVTDFDGRTWENPAGYDQTHRFDVDDGPFADQYQAYTADNPINPDDRLFAYRNAEYFWAGIRLMTPNNTDTTADDEQAREEKRRQDEAERKANRTAFLAFRNTSARSREQYITTSILHDHGTVTDQQIGDTLDQAVTWLIGQALASRLGVQPKHCGEIYDRIMQDTGVPAKIKQSDQWTQPTGEDYQHDLAENKPRRRLTAILILLESRIADFAWCGEPDRTTAKTLYRLLESCGYPTSVDERRALAGHWTRKPGAMGNG